MTHNWSQYQLAIFDDAENGEGNTVVEALAGSAKSSSLVEVINRLNKKISWFSVAFNVKIVDELKKKISNTKNGQISTIHSYGLKCLYKTFDKVTVDQDKTATLIAKTLGKKIKDKNVIYQLIETVRKAKLTLSSSKEEIDALIDRFEIDLFEYPEDDFINHVQFLLNLSKKYFTIVDMEDMIWLPCVLAVETIKYDFVLVDEAQDMTKAARKLILKSCKKGGRIFVFGDRNQCVDVETTVDSEFGPKKVKDLVEGEKILSYLNGKIKYCKVNKIAESSWENGLEIKTKSGRSILVSPNHKLWAESPQDIGNKYIVYLMYRPDMGFRVGKTNLWRNSSNPYGGRTNSEGAERLWVLDIVQTNEEAILNEECYSLKFGVPTAVFNGEQRGLNQNRIDKIFSLFGQNGLDLLKSKNLDFNYPHWTCPSNSINEKLRLCICAHGLKNNTEVSLSWYNEKYNALFEKNKIPFTRGKKSKNFAGFRIRRTFPSYVDALNFANKISALCSCATRETLSYKKGNKLQLITASGIHPGMIIPYKKDGELLLDEVVSVTEKPGKFLDLEIENSANFFGNDILSHNSIMSWAGADSDSMKQFENELNAKVLPLPICYRCPKRVVSHAQKYVPELQPWEHAKEGFVCSIKEPEMMKKATPGCFILSRYNAPLLSLAMKFISEGRPCNILGRNIGQNLSTMIKQSKCKSIDKFLIWLEKWKNREYAKLISKKKDATWILDRFTCLNTLSESCESLKEMKDSIDKLFTDVDALNRITLSSIHRSKGLENTKVFILAYTLRKAPQEEKNLAYVANTRSQSELYLVYKDKKDKKEKQSWIDENSEEISEIGTD